MQDLSHILENTDIFLIFRVGNYMGSEPDIIIRRKRIEAALSKNGTAWWVTTLPNEMRINIQDNLEKEIQIPIFFQANDAGCDPSTGVIWTQTPSDVLATGSKTARTALLIKFKKDLISDHRNSFSLSISGFSKNTRKSFRQLWFRDNEASYSACHNDLYGVGFIHGIFERAIDEYRTIQDVEDYAKRVRDASECESDEEAFQKFCEIRGYLLS